MLEINNRFINIIKISKPKSPNMLIQGVCEIALKPVKSKIYSYRLFRLKALKINQIGLPVYI